MKNVINLFFLLLLNSFVSAQSELSQTAFDLGEISLLNEDVVDLRLKNTSPNAIFILRIEAEKTTSIKYTSKSLTPGETETLRIKLNPKSKGNVSKKVKLYLSSNTEPIELIFSAKVKAIPKDNRQACPDFRSVPIQPNTAQKVSGVGKNFPVFLYDENSNEKHLAELRTTNITTVESPKKTTTVRRSPKVKKVKKTPEERRNSPSIGTILFGKKNDSTSTKIEEEVIAENVQEKKVKQEVILKQERIAQEPIDSTLLDQNFKPNNIIFLIDASTSMREGQKMEILKKSMIELLTPLREIDYLSIVAYSGEAKVILKPTPGNQKEKIAEKIRNLNADGSTNAVKGIKKAIQIGKENFIEGGNNQIFLASDGAFNIGERNKSLRRKIESTAKQGLTIDVLGIKNDNWTNKSLKEIAKLGHGNLIRVKNMKGAYKVLQEVKRNAAR